MTKNRILKYLKEHKNEYNEKYGVIKLGLFGSYARDEQNDSSDIDIVIEISKSKKNIHTFFAIKREMEKAFKKNVDLGIEGTIKTIVKDEINKEIIYV